MFIINAHSQYLETLGELGPVGFFLFLAAVLGGLGVATRCTVRNGRSTPGK
jgi:O-antigen ligase